MIRRFHLIGALLLLGVLLMFALPAPALAEFGSGWSASYYNNAELTGSPVFTEILPNGINFNWGAGSPNPAVPVDNFSARYGSVQNFSAGTYEFVVGSDDGVRVFIDGVLVLDRFIGRVFTIDRFQQTLTAGPHQITVEYMELVDQAQVQFQWFLINASPQIPQFGTPFGQTFFFTPGPSPTPLPTGPTATVTGVRGLALRTGPYLGATFITTLPGDTSYSVIGRNRDEGIYNWYLLQVGERRGWASGRYLTISVDINSLPVMGSVFDEIDGTQHIGAVAIPRAVMNVRARPSMRTPIIGSIPWGTPLELIGRTMQAGENRWYHVRWNEGGIVGWIAAPWVTVEGEIYAVPVR